MNNKGPQKPQKKKKNNNIHVQYKPCTIKTFTIICTTKMHTMFMLPVINICTSGSPGTVNNTGLGPKPRPAKLQEP